MQPDIDLAGLLRGARRKADMSQRQLAQAAKVALGTIAGIESRRSNPSIGIVTKLFAATGHTLLIVDASGKQLVPYDDNTRDRNGRRYPSHLDIYEVGPEGEGWWGTYYPDRVEPGRVAPPYTFFLNRNYRDVTRDVET
jgi:transcriptional regulator with XRE-family HTH domain